MRPLLVARATSLGLSITEYLLRLVLEDLKNKPLKPDSLPDLRHSYEERFLFIYPSRYSPLIAERAKKWDVSINAYLLILVSVDLTLPYSLLT